MEVVIESNQKIFLINNAFIFSKSPWKFNGSQGKIILSGYEDNYGAQLGIVLYMDTDNYQDPIFKILWDDNSTSFEHPDNSCIEVIQ